MDRTIGKVDTDEARSVGSFEFDQFGLEGVHAMAEDPLLSTSFLQLQLLALLDLTHLLQVGAVMDACTPLLQHM